MSIATAPDVRLVVWSRSTTPLQATVLLMIRMHHNRPCPSKREVGNWTGLARRDVWPTLDAMADLGIIEIETHDTDPRRRRLRAPGGKWTDWTARRPEEVTT